MTIASAKELTAAEALGKLRAKEKEVTLLETQLKVHKLRNVQLEANNRMLMLLSLGLCVGCGVFAYDARIASQTTTSTASTPSTTTSTQQTTSGVKNSTTTTVTSEEECDLVVHYDTRYGAGVYAGV